MTDSYAAQQFLPSYYFPSIEWHTTNEHISETQYTLQMYFSIIVLLPLFIFLKHLQPIPLLIPIKWSL